MKKVLQVSQTPILSHVVMPGLDRGESGKTAVIAATSPRSTTHGGDNSCVHRAPRTGELFPQRVVKRRHDGSGFSLSRSRSGVDTP